MHTPNMADTQALARRIIDALRNGQTVEVRATSGVIRMVRKHDRFVYCQHGDIQNWFTPLVQIESEIESLRRYGYLTETAVTIR